MIDTRLLIYLHGLESSSQGFKARRFAQKFPGMLTPDFTGPFRERMQQLIPILGEKTGWTIIGSSYGGLMGATFAHDHPEQMRKLVLLAPAIILPEFASRTDLHPVSVPTVLIHGNQDELLSPGPLLSLAESIFTNLTYIPVDDDHLLHKSFLLMDWDQILE